MGRGRLLITGATGFVGHHVVPAMARAGLPLTLAVRNAGFAPPAGDVRVVRIGDLGPATDWREALGGASDVLHLAAHVHVAPERATAADEARFDAVNHRGTERLFAAAADGGVRRFVFLSSITVLGSRSPPGAPLDDAAPPAPETVYARSKWAAESALRAAHDPGRPDLVILRPPLVCGPGAGGNLGRLLRLARLPLPLPFGAVHNRRTLLSIDNLCSALHAVLRHPEPASGSYNLGDSAPVSTAAIVAALRAGLGRRPSLLPVPPVLMNKVAAATGQGAFARRLFGDLHVSSDAFRRDFGWRDVVDTGASLARMAAAGARAR